MKLKKDACQIAIEEYIEPLLKKQHGIRLVGMRINRYPSFT